MKLFLDSANLKEIEEAVSWAVSLRLAALPSPTPPQAGCPGSVGCQEMAPTQGNSRSSP